MLEKHRTRELKLLLSCCCSEGSLTWNVDANWAVNHEEIVELKGGKQDNPPTSGS
jgi:hypothetical protein